MSIGSVGSAIDVLGMLGQSGAQSPMGEDAAMSVMKKALDSANSAAASLVAQIDPKSNSNGHVNVYA
jgi:hypothetical protein